MYKELKQNFLIYCKIDRFYVNQFLAPSLQNVNSNNTKEGGAEDWNPLLDNIKHI